MKKPQENICKIATESVCSPLTTLYFVFEKKNTNRGKQIVRAAHAMYMTVSGCGDFRVGNMTRVLNPGTLVFVFAGEEHEISGDDGFEYMYITFKGAKADELFDRFAVNRSNRIFDGFESLLPLWQTAIGKADSTNLDLISESVLLYSFSQMSKSSENSEQHLAGEIINYIETYFSDSSLSLSSAAEALGYSPKYISRIFSKNVGVTFSEYLKNTRIQHSVFLVENGVTTVKNVALLSGYSDPLYFSNVFKASLGISPSEYVAKVHENEDE